MNSLESAALICVSLLAAAWHLLVSWRILQLRHSQLFQVRIWWLSTAHVAFVGLSQSYSNLAAAFRMNCFNYDASVYGFWGLGVLLEVARQYVFYQKYNLSRKVAQFLRMTAGKEKESGLSSLERERQKVSTKSILAVILIPYAVGEVCLILYMIYHVRLDRSIDVFHPECALDLYFWGACFIGIIFVFVINAELLRRLRKAKENLVLLQEVKRRFSLYIIFVITIIASAFINSPIAFSLISQIYFCGIAYISGWSICNSAVKFEAMKKASPSEMEMSKSCSSPSKSALFDPDFIEMLSSESDEYLEFVKYLELEFSVENILFWKAVHNFEKSFEVMTPNDAWKIFQDYCRFESPLSVNISSECRKALEELFSKKENVDAYLHKDVFKPAQTEILSLMMSDSYSRFKRHRKLQKKTTYAS